MKNAKAITLGSALIAHFAVGDDVSVWIWAAGSAVLWALSYYFFRKLPPAEGRAMRRTGNLPSEAHAI